MRNVFPFWASTIYHCPKRAKREIFPKISENFLKDRLVRWFSASLDNLSQVGTDFVSVIIFIAIFARIRYNGLT